MKKLISFAVVAGTLAFPFLAMAANTNNDTDSIQALASEYSVTDAGSIYDLNLEK